MYDGMERPVYDERDPRLPMSAEDVVRLLAAMDGIDVWLDGGWGVDALLGEQTREHDDLDLVVARSDVPLLIEALGREGYEVAKGQLPTCIVLLDPAGRQVDVHPVEPSTRQATASTGWRTAGTGRIPRAGFAGEGIDCSARACRA